MKSSLKMEESAWKHFMTLDVLRDEAVRWSNKFVLWYRKDDIKGSNVFEAVSNKSWESRHVFTAQCCYTPQFETTGGVWASGGGSWSLKSSGSPKSTSLHTAFRHTTGIWFEQSRRKSQSASGLRHLETDWSLNASRLKNPFIKTLHSRPPKRASTSFITFWYQ